MSSTTRARHAPVQLAPNTIASFYDGAGRIADWRGDPSVPPTHPEDWIASVSRRTGMGDLGLTILPGGTSLAEAIADDPDSWLGPDHVSHRGRTTGMLLKLLDAGQRLPVHVHPDGSFARAHLGQPNGKAEAWLVLHADDGATVHLGFSREVALSELESWADQQDTEALLGALNELPARAGDVLYCPPGVPHAIGAGILVVEIQEPSDLSIMLEWRGFPIEPSARFLGLDRATAFDAVDRSPYSDDRLASLRGATISPRGETAQATLPLMPTAAQTYFSADLLTPLEGTLHVPPRFSVLFITEGQGTLEGDDFAAQALQRGQVWLVPWSAGATRLNGSVQAIACYVG